MPEAGRFRSELYEKVIAFLVPALDGIDKVETQLFRPYGKKQII